MKTMTRNFKNENVRFKCWEHLETAVSGWAHTVPSDEQTHGNRTAPIPKPPAAQ